MQNYFCLTNDPDHGLYKDYKIIFKELTRNEIFTTSAVFCTLKDDGSFLSNHCNKNDTDTLQNEKYRDLMLWARDNGHEIAYHGYSQVSDTREEFQKGLDLYKKWFGDYPSTFIEHGSHPKIHPIERCKKDNLAYLGSSLESPYYVRDIVSKVFKCTWSHEFLLDNISTPLNQRDIFQFVDGIVYFKRWRNRYIIPLFSRLTPENNTLIGYTHFGYRGYKSKKERILFWTEQKYQLENWQGRDAKYSASILSELIQMHKAKSVTVNQLYNIVHEA